MWGCYRFTVKLRENQPAVADCLNAVTAALQAELPGIGRDVAIDASDLTAFANGQRYVSKGGRERERFSNPDASWGTAPPSRRGPAAGTTVCKIHAAVDTVTGLPLAWRIETARRNDSLFVAPLLDAFAAWRASGFMPI